MPHNQFLVKKKINGGNTNAKRGNRGGKIAQFLGLVWMRLYNPKWVLVLEETITFATL
jgi:hypothetical protein